MTMNKPTCYACSDYQLTPGGFVPGANNQDKGRLTLVANVPQDVTFARISVLDATKWIFVGVPLCYNSDNATVGFEITAKTGTGFTVTAMEDSTFEYKAERI